VQKQETRHPPGDAPLEPTGRIPWTLITPLHDNTKVPQIHWIILEVTNTQTKCAAQTEPNTTRQSNGELRRTFAPWGPSFHEGVATTVTIGGHSNPSHPVHVVEGKDTHTEPTLTQKNMMRSNRTPVSKMQRRMGNKTKYRITTPKQYGTNRWPQFQRSVGAFSKQRLNESSTTALTD
jgi:hypothetical protein